MLFLYLKQQQQQTKQTKNKNKIDVYVSNDLRWSNSDSFMGWADGTKGQ